LKERIDDLLQQVELGLQSAVIEDQAGRAQLEHGADRRDECAQCRIGGDACRGPARIEHIAQGQPRQCPDRRQHPGREAQRCHQKRHQIEVEQAIEEPDHRVDQANPIIHEAGQLEAESDQLREHVA